MKKFLTKIIGATLGFAMVIGAGVGAAMNNTAPTYATIDTANGYKAATLAAGSNCDAVTVNSLSGMKAGTSKKSGDMTVTVPAGSTDLRFYAAAWKDSKNATLSIAKKSGSDDATISANSVNLTADSGISNNSPFTLNGAESNYCFDLTLTNISSDTVYKLSSSVRFVVWSAQTKVNGGGQDEPKDLTNPKPQYDDETKIVSWTTDANATKYQIKVDFESYKDIETATYDARNLSVGNEHTVSIKAVGDETNYKSAEGSVTFKPTAYEIHRKFIVTSTRSVEEKGDTISGSSTSFVNTYSNAKDQITKDNSMTLSITGLSKKVTINKLVLSMKSNKDKGAGSISVTIDGEETFIVGTSSENGVGFNTFPGVENFSTTYSDVVWDKLNFIAKSSILINIYGTVSSLYCESFNIFFSEQENNDYITALSVTPNVWNGYESQMLQVEDFTVSVTVGGVAGSAVDYTFLGIGYMDGDTFVARDANFIYGYPQVSDTRLCWKANYPTEVGGSTYLYAYVTLNVSVDTVSSVVISGGMGKTSYFTRGSWEYYGLKATAVFASGNTQDVTGFADYKYYSDSAMTNEVATPEALGVGADQNIYVKATYEDISNAEGYAQTVTVTVEHGSVITDPLTADEAIEMGKDLRYATDDEYYILGVVSEIYENKLDTEGYATFYLVDTNKEIDFEAFKIKLDKNCKNTEDLKVGAEVLLLCTIRRFNAQTIENGQNNGVILSITYSNPVLSSVVLDRETAILAIGDKLTLTASPLPVGAELGTVEWSSSDEKVASVVDGVVTANAVGKATIIAKAGEFEAKCSISVYADAEMKYSGGEKNINMAKTGNADTVGLDDKMFTVTAEKGDASVMPGLNTNGEIRLYKGSKDNNGCSFTVTIDSKYTISAIEVGFKTGSQHATIYADGVAVKSLDGSVYEINATNFTIKDTGEDRIEIEAITIFYRDASAQESVERMTTQTSLAYHYKKDAEGNYTYSDISIRFGGRISKDLWEALDTDEHKITGFGVIIADGDFIETAEDMAAIVESTTPSTESTDLSKEYAIDYFVSVENFKKVIGEDGDEYFWNLRQSVDSNDMNKYYSAVAYIKLGDKYVLMNMARETVETIAIDYLNNRGVDPTIAGGSLKNIVNNAHLA